MDDVEQPQTPPPGAPRVADLVDVDLSEPTTYLAGPPHAAFDVLRAEAPVAWQDEHDSTTRTSAMAGGETTVPPSPGYWAVTSHELVGEVSRQPELFSSYLGGVQMFNADELTLAGLRLMMLFMDPPDQARLRRIVSPAFTPRAVALLRQSVEDNAAEIADGLDGTFDVVESVSKELTTRILAGMLGMPSEDRHLIVKWSDTLIGFQSADVVTDPMAVITTFGELNDYGRQVLADRRARPTEDLMSDIANAVVEGERLTEDEFCMFWLLLIIAGNETTRNTISGSVIALQQHDVWTTLAKNSQVLATAGSDELIRYVSPVMQFRRTATTDTELGGQHIRAGDKVVLWYTAANRDPKVFADPHSLDLTRIPNPHLAFGVGPHFCLGTRLAKLQVSTMLSALLSRYPGLELAGEPRYAESNFIAGITHLPATV